MELLLTVIVTWLSISFGLPAVDEHPSVEFVSAPEMAEVRYSGAESGGATRVVRETNVATTAGIGHPFQAVYDDRTRTIYLPEGWTGATPAEVSVLVHELVHHLQNVGGLTYACPQAREKPAYQAQARWLELFGESLDEAFGLDAMTILVRTSCVN